MEIDCLIGPVRHEGEPRINLPDCEISLGIVKNVEVAYVGLLAFERPEGGGSLFGAHVWENGWLSVEVGLLRVQAPKTKSHWSLGVRAGPMLPLIDGSHGPGFAALGLVGRTIGGDFFESTRFTFGIGGLVDSAMAGSDRPVAAIALGDVEADMKFHDLELVGSLEVKAFASSDPSELTILGGVTWAPDGFEVSILGVAGALEGGDRYGVLLRFDPKITLWK
jgi:hypothetical protein